MAGADKTVASSDNTKDLNLCSSFLRALGIPMITDRILFYLPLSDVLECSLVSEFWRKLCRMYLRDRKRLEINLDIGSLFQLEKLDHLLVNSTILPFAGSRLSADLIYTHSRHSRFRTPNSNLPDVLCFQRQKNDVEALCPNILQKLPVKTLRIRFSQSQNTLTPDDCACVFFLKKLLITRASSTTEYLEILYWPLEDLSLWKFLNIQEHSEDPATLHQSNLFQSLRTFNLRNLTNVGILEYEMLICEIIISSPMLQNIYGSLPNNLFIPLGDADDGVANNTLSLQVPRSKLFMVMRDVIVSSHHAIDLLLVFKPKLELFGFDPKIILPSDGGPEPELYVQKSLATIIENSSSSLTTLLCNDLTHLLPRAINIVLFNCTVLQLQISPPYRDFEDDLLFLKAINFQMHLPNLRSLDLLFKIGRWYEQIFAKNRIKDRASLYRCARYTCFSVNTISVTYHGTDFHEKIQSWPGIADVFPSVKSLHLINACNLKQAPEKMCNLGLLWNENLEVVTCCFIETNEKWCWVLLTELLENLCDISIEELWEVRFNNFNEWSYAPTRPELFKHKGSSRIVITMTHYRLCVEDRLIQPDVYMQYKTRFDLISTWISAKLPEFSLTLKFKPCRRGQRNCNPLHFYDGRIRKENIGPYGVGYDFETWHLNF